MWTVKYPPASALTAAIATERSKLSVAIPKPTSKFLCSRKPLHLPSIDGIKFCTQKEMKKRRGDIAVKALEAEGGGDLAEKSIAAKRVKIGIYFATWWALNVVFNIYNKKVLNAYPFPWLTSTLSLATGSLMMLISWATRIAEPPKVDADFWKVLFPVRKTRFQGFCFLIILGFI